MFIDFMLLLTIFTNFAFIYVMVESRLSKDKIFFTIYTGWVSLLFIFFASLLELTVFIVILYILNLALCYLFYTNFTFFSTLSEIVLKRIEIKPKESKINEVFSVWISSKLKEIQTLKKNVVKLTYPEKNIVDFVMIMLWLIVAFLAVYVFYFA